MAPSHHARLPWPALLLAASLCLAPLAGVAHADALGDGAKALQEKRWAEAADAYAKALGNDRTRRAAALGLAEAAARGRLAERLGEAEDAATRLVKEKPDDVEARVALGHVFMAQAQGKEDAKAKEFTFRDAQLQFEKALAVAPEDVEAAAGLAQAVWLQGDFERVVEITDSAIERKPSGPAWYWQGQAYYELARARYASEPGSEATVSLFRKARGAYEASTRLDPASYDAWMQLGYASQYLGAEHVAGALEAYKKAAALDGESRYPLLGIGALYASRTAEYVPALEALARELPQNAVVWFFLGYTQFTAQRWEPAAKALDTYLGKSRRPDPQAWLWLGQSLSKAGKEGEAVKALEKGLAADPRSEFIAEELDQRLRATHARSAGDSPSEAKACADAYERLARMAPSNPYVLNNGAFILREAYVRHQGDAAWLPVLRSSAGLYERASAIIDEQPQDVLEGAPFAKRYAWAQITSDTGLMFQFYDATRDPAKAEAYYLRALRMSEDGYFDAWNNLHRMYLGQQAWDKAFDLARRAAEGLKLESGAPHATGRAMATAEAKRLLAEGKVKDE